MQSTSRVIDKTSVIEYDDNHILPLANSEMDAIDGGWLPIAAAIVGTGAAGFAAGTFFGWYSTH